MICDLCGSSNYEPYKCVAPDDQKIVECRGCGLVFTYPRPSGDHLDEVIAKDPCVFRDPEVIGARRQGHYQTMLQELMRYQKAGRLLDVGCAYGFFLELARAAGFEVYGVEIQELSARYAQEQLGIPVFAGSLYDAHFAGGFFDVIVMWELLEHVPSPMKMLREAFRVARTGAVLSIVVPNVDSYHARKNPDWWLPYHFYHFSQATISKYLDETCWHIESLTVNPHFPGGNRASSRKQFVYSRIPWIVPLARSFVRTKLGRFVVEKVGTGALTVYARKGA